MSEEKKGWMQNLNVESLLNALGELEQEVVALRETKSRLEHHIEDLEATKKRLWEKMQKHIREIAQFDHELRELVGLPQEGK